jgi:hypothetical protein
MRPLIWVVLVEALVFGVLGFLWVTRASASHSGQALALHEEPNLDAPLDGGTDLGARDARVERARGEDEGSSAAEEPSATNIVVCGTVRDAAGQPIADASVTFTRLGTSRRGASVKNGAYAVASLQSGTWQVSCRVKDFADLRVEHVLDDRDRQTIDLEMRPWYVVEVFLRTPAGEPVVVDRVREMQGWALSVFGTEEPLVSDLPAFAATRLDAGGIGKWTPVWSDDGPKAEEARRRGVTGELYLDRAPPAYAALFLRHLFLQSQRVEAGQRELVFIVEPALLDARLGSVKLRVLDGATGAPMPGANVVLATPRSYGIGKGDQRTDAEGRAQIGCVMPGAVELRIAAPDHEHLVVPLRVPAGRELDLGDMVLSPVVAIQGRVVGAEPAAMSEVSITWTDLDRRSATHELSANVTTGIDAEGRFSLPYAGRHRYAIRVSSGDGSFGNAVVDARNGPPEPVEIRLAAGTSIGVRCDHATARILVVTDAAGVPVRILRIGFGSRSSSISLPPGAYTVQVYAGDEQLERTLPLRVGTAPLEIDLR